MKKYLPLLIFIMAFSGFLSTQILWDTFHLNAEQVDQEKKKYALYETEFQALKITTTKNTSVEIKNDKTPIIILNFWASWCLPCLKEFPSLVSLQKKYPQSLKVIGINGDEENPHEQIKKIENKYNLNFDSIVDSDSTVANKFLVNSYPVSIVFHKGKVIYFSQKIHNFMDESFIKLIDNALKAN
jgi:thiol-disulfide isomerase/thioredoxin